MCTSNVLTTEFWRKGFVLLGLRVARAAHSASNGSASPPVQDIRQELLKEVLLTQQQMRQDMDVMKSNIMVLEDKVHTLEDASMERTMQLDR